MVSPLRIVDFDYVLQVERNLPKEQQTVWKLKTALAKTKAKIRDHLIYASGVAQARHERFNLGMVNYMVLQHGLKGWENFGDVKFTPDKDGLASEVSISYIPEEHHAEISNAINGGPDYDHKKFMEDNSREIVPAIANDEKSE